MTKQAQKTGLDEDDEDLHFTIPDDAMSPDDVKAKNGHISPSGSLPKNHSLPELIGSGSNGKLSRQNSNNNNNNENNSTDLKQLNDSSAVISTVEKVVVDVKSLSIKQVTDEAFKLHPVYANVDEFNHPKIGPPQGKIPRQSYFFDVIVGGVATPSNFYVRSYVSSKSLESIEAQMLEWYVNSYSQVSLQMENLILDGYYVLKKDNKYFRVKIVPPFSRKGDKVMAELLDYGGYVQVEPKQLLPIHKAYSNLPTQAWKAKLQVPSWPASIKWSPEDCDRFKVEVEGKSLVALILGESIDDFTNERCLGCVLVDTSTNKDAYIHLQFNDKINKSK